MTEADMLAIGAPKLPVGQFYRVRRPGLGIGLVNVSIRQDRRFLYSVEMASYNVLALDLDTWYSASVAIKYAAEQCYAQLKNNRLARERYDEALKLVGDHR